MTTDSTEDTVMVALTEAERLYLKSLTKAHQARTIINPGLSDKERARLIEIDRAIRGKLSL